jgi:hypothetical protein
MLALLEAAVLMYSHVYENALVAQKCSPECNLILLQQLENNGFVQN